MLSLLLLRIFFFLVGCFIWYIIWGNMKLIWRIEINRLVIRLSWRYFDFIDWVDDVNWLL